MVTGERLPSVDPRAPVAPDPKSVLAQLTPESKTVVRLG